MYSTSNFREVDVEDLGKKYTNHIHKKLDEPDETNVYKYLPMIKELLLREHDYTNRNMFFKVARSHKFPYKHSYLYKVFEMLKSAENFSADDEAYMREVLKIKDCKSQSGIISVTVFTSPYPEYYDAISGEYKKQSFSCKWNCAYCPNEPGQPRSYLTGEPGVLRANRVAFDCVAQMHVRMQALYNIGHPIDKLEVLVLGGTWCSYPLAYREQFVRDIYFAANTFMGQSRPASTLKEEKTINKTTSCKVIGLTLETRPDTINARELKLFRYYGCTRVQLGIQHIDNDVLKAIKRNCTNEANVRAIKLLKDCGFKVDAHFMPNLPGSNVEKDENMIMHNLLGVQSLSTERQDDGILFEHYTLHNEAIQADQWKVYPCTIVPFTEIEQWYREGKYVPYDNKKLEDLLIRMKTSVFPFIRLNRIVRDIPNEYSFLSDYRSNMRQSVQDIMKKKGLICNCIRCREVKSQTFDFDDMIMVVRQYNASDGIEYFISFESSDLHILYGFLRLRINGNSATNVVFNELNGCALIRELHTYGQLQMVGLAGTNTHTDGQHVQHRGLGKRLIAKAEAITASHGLDKIAVISGEGVRGYYEYRGFNDVFGDGHFMIKSIT
jgi:ELP3 family radical SAM enzyme/protein acetyltransferase